MAPPETEAEAAEDVEDVDGAAGDDSAGTISVTVAAEVSSSEVAGEDTGAELVSGAELASKPGSIREDRSTAARARPAVASNAAITMRMTTTVRRREDSAMVVNCPSVKEMNGAG
ncbi:hypothetical protein CDOO_11645 [Corynebacterium doosanense CAU 212 = DSM 45436]|uniref:Uncharacterized protein n=1 Tax=Corynebacterium doosanense CAU 212 = DSM 45436 TaxID=558173 RepID=A0A097IJK4_9CORY|nr:hypothetical protein CDOO_11645 [Corynebacterium doosanense CAU 212 = DSM 45436]